LKELIEKRLHELEKHFEKNLSFSYDPYDGLNTPLRKLLFKNKFLERLWLQFVRLFPFNIRILFGIKKIIHTKTISDLLSASCLLYGKTNNELYFNKASGFYSLLKNRSIKEKNGIGWGLNFYFTTRFVQADDKTTNLFQIVNALNALLDFYEVLKKKNSLEKCSELKELIEKALNFILRDLGFKESNDVIIWNYWKNLESPIFNVNALMAGFLSRYQKVFSITSYNKYISKTIEFLKQGQNKDGSWYYSADSKAKFIDGFHTGYILEGLSLAKLNGIKMDDIFFDKAVNYYLQNLFTPDALPKYYNNNIYPIDGQNFAQALQTLHFLNKLSIVTFRYIEKVLKKSDSILWNENGYYNAMKTKLFIYKTPMDRWVNTPMYLSLAHLY